MVKIVVYHLDDDLFEQRRVAESVKKSHDFCEFEIASFSTVKELMSAIKARPKIDLFLLDMHLESEDSKESGADVIAEIRSKISEAVCVMHSGDATSIRECLAQGADDFILKADDLSELPYRLFTIFRHRSAAADVVPKPTRYPPPPVIGKTMQELAKRVHRISDSAMRSIYVLGPSGAGKEVIASVLESCLPTGMPFVKVNCAAIAPNLLESELFGHAKGAFTGAIQPRAGLLESASGGWIFLDEIASLSPSAQAAMLRAIENQEITRVGEATARKIRLKFIAASNISLEKLVKDGFFRNDLFQRLREAELVIPPLNDRREDIPFFIEHFCKTEPGGPYQVSPEALHVLVGADWSQGNVRGLRNALRAMTEFSMGGMLTVKGLPKWLWEKGSKTGKSDAAVDFEHLKVPFDAEVVPAFETLCDRLLVAAVESLHSTGKFSSLRKISEALAVSRTTMTNHLKRAIDSKYPVSKAVLDLLSGK